MKLVNSESGKFEGYLRNIPISCLLKWKFPFWDLKRINRSSLSLALRFWSRWLHFEFMAYSWACTNFMQITFLMLFFFLAFLHRINFHHGGSLKNLYALSFRSPIQATQTIKVKDLFSSRAFVGTKKKELPTRKGFFIFT